MKMKSRIISIWRSIVLRYGDYRRGVYVRRMERTFGEMLRVDFLRGVDGEVSSPYRRCIRVNGILPIFEVTDDGVCDMVNGFISVGDVDTYLSSLHAIWMCEKGYTLDEVSRYVRGGNGDGNK